MKKVKINDNVFEFPEHWNEIKESEQLVNLAQIHFSKREKDTNLLDALNVLIDTKKTLKTFRAKPVSKSLIKDIKGSLGKIDLSGFTRENIIISKLSKLLIWVNDISLHNYLHKDILKFSIDDKEYIGPGDEFGFLTFNEYINLDTLLFYYANSPSNVAGMYFDKMVSILYRPKQDDCNKYGDFREKFMPNQLEKAVKNIAPIKTIYKMLALCYFTSCRKQVIKSYPEIFEKGDSEPKRKNKIEKLQPPNWNPILYNLATSGQWLDREAVENDLLFNVLEYWKENNKKNK